MSASASLPSDLSKLSNNQAGYQTYFDEINRRAEATKDEDSKFFKKIDTGGQDLPFELNDQKYVVFSLSSKEIPPKAIDAKQPAFRIMGCFSSQEDAKEHADFVSESNKQVSLFIDECRTWIVIPDTFENCVNAQHISDVKTKLLQEYAKVRKHDDEEFEKAREGCDIERTVRTESDAQVDNVPKTTPESRSHILKGSCNIHGQDLAVVVILPNHDTGEAMFQILGCFSKQEDADRWIRNVASRKILNYDMHVISTCQWIFPNRMQGDGAQNMEYRNPELQKIMEKQRAAPGEVKQFEEWVNQNNESELLESAPE